MPKFFFQFFFSLSGVRTAGSGLVQGPFAALLAGCSTALNLAYYLIECCTEVRRTPLSLGPWTNPLLAAHTPERRKKRGINLGHCTERWWKNAGTPKLPENRTYQNFWEIHQTRYYTNYFGDRVIRPKPDVWINNNKRTEFVDCKTETRWPNLSIWPNKWYNLWNNG